MEVEIVYLEVPLTVKGIFYPEELELMYDSDISGCPGYPPEFDIHEVFAGGVSIIDLLSDNQLDDIKSETIKKIEE